MAEDRRSQGGEEGRCLLPKQKKQRGGVIDVQREEVEATPAGAPPTEWGRREAQVGRGAAPRPEGPTQSHQEKDEMHLWGAGRLWGAGAPAAVLEGHHGQELLQNLLNIKNLLSIPTVGS